MVALSHATARELGYDTSDDADRPFVEVSGRKGLGVKADDLLDRLTDKAAAEVAKRNADLTPEETRAIAEAIAIAAVRYFMVKFSRGKIIVFDIDEALSFEGESGPYLQYAVVRANNIFNKLKERHGLDAGGGRGSACRVAACGARPADDDEAHDLWGLVLEAARLDEVVEQACARWSCRSLARYAFGLAQAFNGFYHRYPILNEEREDVRALARRRRRLLPRAADAGAGADGLRRCRRGCRWQLAAISYQLLVRSRRYQFQLLAVGSLRSRTEKRETGTRKRETGSGKPGSWNPDLAKLMSADD